jgi:hypothetical protein
MKTASRQRRLLYLTVLSCVLSGCSLLPGSSPPPGYSAAPTPIDKLFSPAQRNIPGAGALLPNNNIQLTPSVGISLEKLVFWGAYAGAAYLILDPLAPNWEIEQAAFPDNHYHFSLKMKRFYAGGTGESRQVFHQRAKDLMRQGGYDGYQVLEYSESLESSVLGSQRVSQGVIRLTRR